MLFPHLSFLLEVIGACLLLVMIVFAVQLNRRLSLLQADKARLQKLIATFNDSTERAEASVAKLRANALEASEAIQVSMTQARQLRDDLAFMIDRASGVADRLEKSIGAGRTETVTQSLRSSGDPVSDLRAANACKKAPQSAPAKDGNKASLMRALAGMR